MANISEEKTYIEENLDIEEKIDMLLEDYDYTWNDIYDDNENYDKCINFDDVNDSNMDLYEKICELNITSIADCVMCGMELNNHAVFAHYYMEKLKINKKEVFVEKLKEYLDRDDNKFPCERLGNIKIAKSKDGFWRYQKTDGDNTKELFLKNRVGSNSVTDWKKINGKFPNRDEIIQLGLSLNLNVDQVNELLGLANHEHLYAVDLVDCVCMFYLNYYSGKENIEKDKQVKQEKRLNDRFERLLNVKRTIDNKLKTDFATGKITSVGDQKYKAHFYDKLLKYDDKTKKYNLYNELEQYRKLLDEKDVEIDIFKTRELTRVLQSDLENCKNEEDLDVFLEEYIDFFNNKYYGYLLKLSKYITTVNLYEKNLNISSMTFDKDDPHAVSSETEDELNDENYGFEDYIDMLSQYEERNLEEDVKAYNEYLKTNKIPHSSETTLKYLARKCIDQGLLRENFIEKYDNQNYFEGDGDNPHSLLKKSLATSLYAFNEYPMYWTLENISSDHNRFIELIKYIGEIENALEIDEQKKHLTRPKSDMRGSYAIINLFEGATDKTNYRLMNLGSKAMIIKFLIATGREEEIVSMLGVAGYWDVKNACDYTSEDFFREGYVEDHHDVLIRYALAYKEALIDYWIEEEIYYDDNTDHTMLKQKLNKAFPFLRLVMSINRDIQMLLRRYYGEMVSENELISLEDINKIESNMIYPVLYSGQEWFRFD